MKKTINICDRCGRECFYESIYATVDRVTDAAGSMDDIVEDVDLCPLCMRARMEQMVQQMTPSQRAAWVEASRKKPEVRR